MVIALGCANRGSEGAVHPAKVHKLRSEKGAFVTTYDSRGRGAYIVVNTTGGLKNSSTEKSILLCAEPPPDASGNVDYADALKTSVEASAAYELIKAAVDVGVEREVSASSEIVDVAARSELVMLMRDALYRLCEFHLNGTMTPEQISENYTELLRMAKQMGQRDNVSSLVHALEVAIENDESKDVVQDILVTIQALSFVEAAEASRSLALKSMLTTAAARSLLTDQEAENIKKQLEQELTDALSEAKAELATAQQVLSTVGNNAQRKKQAEADVAAAQAEVDHAQKELHNFLGTQPKPE